MDCRRLGTVALFEGARRQQDLMRPKGLHVTDIIQSIVTTLDPKKYEGISEESRQAYQELGNVFEDVVAGGLARRLTDWTKPAPRRLQGIICSPDGWNARLGELCEIKATWKKRFASAEEFRDSPKTFSYRLQGRAYCKVWQTHRIKFYVFHVNGDYKPPRPVEPDLYICTWPEREIDEAWDLIVQHAKDMGRL